MNVTLTDEDLELLRGKTNTPDVLQCLARRDREIAWKEKIASVVQDLRVWPIIAAIAENPCGDCIRGRIAPRIDIMGVESKSFPIRNKRGRKTGGIQCESGITICGITLSHKGWKLAKPDVQNAVDFLNLKFPANVDLDCALGEYWVEEIWTDDDDYQFRKFDMGHGASGTAASCYPVFPVRKDEQHGMVSVWSRVLHLPKTKELVRVDGWEKCGYCEQPKRPKTNEGRPNGAGKVGA